MLAVLLLAGLLCGAIARGDESLAERRQRIENMTPADKEQLLRRQERFESLAPAERQRLLKLHEEIERDPEAGQLRKVLHRYSEWLKTLPEYRRLELLELDPKERIQRIKQLQEQQATNNARRSNPKDLEALFRWMDDYAAKNEDRFLETLPADRRQQFDKMNPSMRRRMVVWLMWQRWQTPEPGRLPMMSPADLADLLAKFSPETQKRLENLPPAEQWRTIAGWVRQEMRTHSYQRKMPGLVPVDEEHLADFFERDITPEERDRLLNLSGDEMQRELRRLYLTRYKLVEPGLRPPEGPGHGKRPGGPGPEWGHPRKPDTGPGKPDRPSRPEPPPAAPSDKAAPDER